MPKCIFVCTCTRVHHLPQYQKSNLSLVLKCSFWDIMKISEILCILDIIYVVHQSFKVTGIEYHPNGRFSSVHGYISFNITSMEDQIILQKNLFKYVLHLYYIKDCFKHPSKISSAIIGWRRANRLPIYPKEAVVILHWPCKGVWNMPTSCLGKVIYTNNCFIHV